MPFDLQLGPAWAIRPLFAAPSEPIMTAVLQPMNLSHHPLSTQPAMQSHDTALMWFRRDLRLTDNAALFYALKHCKRVLCVFVFDKTILDALPNKADRRVDFIWQSALALQSTLRSLGGDLLMVHAHSEEAIVNLVKQSHATAVFTNKDYEPAARKRDTRIEAELGQLGVAFYPCKDHVIFEESEVLTKSGGTFSVFTPYKNAWLKRLDAFHLTPYPVEQRTASLAPWPESARTLPEALATHSLQSMGFEPTEVATLIPPGEAGAKAGLEDFLNRIDRYKTARDYPAVKGVSYLSVHMRFGTLPIRQAAKAAWDRVQATGCEGAMGWLNELIWRDFYFQIIFHRPQAAEGAFKPEYNAIAWEQGEKAERLFKAWCEGRTGYPIVDAAMRQLNQTGYQHNRLRMITASFLTKDLGIDWRWGEKYFAEQLNDFDLAANNGGWQWAASSGCDAQPYFRIFNPVSQSEKFDPEGKFIRRYCPELAKLPNKWIHNPIECPPLDLQAAGVHLGETYPRPVVDHALARQTTLQRYAVVKKSGGNSEPNEAT